MSRRRHGGTRLWITTISIALILIVVFSIFHSICYLYCYLKVQNYMTLLSIPQLWFLHSSSYPSLSPSWPLL
jgi:hypothetical protein